MVLDVYIENLHCVSAYKHSCQQYWEIISICIFTQTYLYTMISGVAGFKTENVPLYLTFFFFFFIFNFYISFELLGCLCGLALYQ